MKISMEEKTKRLIFLLPEKKCFNLLIFLVDMVDWWTAANDNLIEERVPISMIPQMVKKVCAH